MRLVIQGDESVPDQMREVGALLDLLSSHEDELDQLRAAFEARDTAKFGEVLGRELTQIGVPPDRCDPFVHVIVLLSSPPKRNRRCEWTDQSLSKAGAKQIAEVIRTGADADRLRGALETLGLIKCEETLDLEDVIEVDRFVRGVCPWGTF